MSDEFPFTGTNTVTAEEDLPLYKEYAWVFDTDKFIYDNAGNHVLVEGNEAVKVWIYKGEVLPKGKQQAQAAQPAKPAAAAKEA